MSFATTSDIETRLGRELTDSETAFCTDALDSVASIIGVAAGKDQDWVDALDPVPKVLKELSIDVVIRAGQNPEGLLSDSETLGQYTRTQRFPDPGQNPGTGMFLSPPEERLVRQTINGPGSSTSVPLGIIDSIPEQPLPTQMQPPVTDVLDGGQDNS